MAVILDDFTADKRHTCEGVTMEIIILHVFIYKMVPLYLPFINFPMGYTNAPGLICENAVTLFLIIIYHPYVFYQDDIVLL